MGINTVKPCGDLLGCNVTGDWMLYSSQPSHREWEGKWEVFSWVRVSPGGEETALHKLWGFRNCSSRPGISTGIQPQDLESPCFLNQSLTSTRWRQTIAGMECSALVLWKLRSAAAGQVWALINLEIKQTFILWNCIVKTTFLGSGRV